MKKVDRDVLIIGFIKGIPGENPASVTALATDLYPELKDTSGIYNNPKTVALRDSLKKGGSLYNAVDDYYTAKRRGRPVPTRFTEADVEILEALWQKYRSFHTFRSVHEDLMTGGIHRHSAAKEKR
ncbi:MAG TPA: hypothetical protein VFE94_00745 [Candidatus Paceibacterota bacterium]|nr:hypothetical protein [Candidatus Paceibacterota bacterium]